MVKMAITQAVFLPFPVVTETMRAPSEALAGMLAFGLQQQKVKEVHSTHLCLTIRMGWIATPAVKITDSQFA